MEQLELSTFSDLCKRFSGLISGKKQIVIVPHKDPDGDAIGSCLAWSNILSQKGMSVSVISPNGIPDSLEWMNGYEMITVFDKDKVKAATLIESSELLVFLDFNSASRTGPMKELLQKSIVPKIVIDHHPYPDFELADLIISETGVSSTCELSYLVMEEIGLQPDVHAAECLYAGIMTDTGMLNHNSSKPGIYHTIAHLLEIGIDKEKIHREVFHSNSLGRMRLIGHALCNKMEVLPTGKVALIALPLDELKGFDFKNGDTEGLVNFPLSIDGIEISALITEKEKGFVKISLRSRGMFPVNKYSEKFFSGGGHANAAGGELHASIDKAVKLFCDTVEAFVFNEHP
jgi:bifunctional oligoribonuclease and PAP phosphatase NrnA